MFESTLVDERSESHRPWTVAVSFLGQSLLVLVALLIPLLTTQSLPPGQWMSVLLAPPPPLGAPPAPPRAPQSVAVVAPAIFETDVLMAPATIPDKVALLVEDAAGPPRIDEDSSIGNTVGPIGSTIGVPSSLWSNSSSNRVPLPPPPPPPANPPKPATPRAVRVSTSIQSAKLIHRVVPVYPNIAKQAGVSGVVKIEAIIARDGTIRKLEVHSGHPLLIRSAMDAVKQWRYRPTHLNGKPVEVLTQVEVRFVLR